MVRKFFLFPLPILQLLVSPPEDFVAFDEEELGTFVKLKELANETGDLDLGEASLLLCGLPNFRGVPGLLFLILELFGV